ncbi:receptor expression-enhancing protein 2 [Strongylocentrotus purpuratus]|uniref:Receptor expression-enhancing protein n=1 Tax=Strongylocentrotus purpuratus TaxID=7668 RepID=A0A7M7RFK4_STRPU|nr:receptor expression-enhancing protein 2 [Strongylocentrotus purpuratus]|eukprot:XP_786990.3 PREDICTED: receptor expression-enhancing protein 2 isoform X2 [Strongylocentrotus purpuratus]
MVAYLLSRLVVLVFGTLYPAYYSYKAVKTRNVKEYVKWMMYWIVFALFSCVETVADIFASILPFYYEIKILFIFWLISPWTKGSTYLYRKCIHPALSKKEQEIDEYINQASTRGYEALKRVGRNGMTLAANAVMTSAIKGQTSLLDQIKVYSGIAIAAGTAIEDRRLPPPEGGDSQDEDVIAIETSTRVTRSQQDETDMGTMLTPELHDLDYGASTHGDLLQSLDKLDNRLREEREHEHYLRSGESEWGHEDIHQQPDNDWDRDDRPDKDLEYLISDQYEDQPPQPKPRAKPRSPPRRKPTPPTHPIVDQDSESSDVERPATLRRSTSLRSSGKSRTYSSTENLSTSRGRYASTENLTKRQLSRRQEMMSRSLRHSTRQTSNRDAQERRPPSHQK